MTTTLQYHLNDLSNQFLTLQKQSTQQFDTFSKNILDNQGVIVFEHDAQVYSIVKNDDQYIVTQTNSVSTQNESLGQVTFNQGFIFIEGLSESIPNQTLIIGQCTNHNQISLLTQEAGEDLEQVAFFKKPITATEPRQCTKKPKSDPIYAYNKLKLAHATLGRAEAMRVYIKLPPDTAKQVLNLLAQQGPIELLNELQLLKAAHVELESNLQGSIQQSIQENTVVTSNS